MSTLLFRLQSTITDDPVDLLGAIALTATVELRGTTLFEVGSVVTGENDQGVFAQPVFGVIVEWISNQTGKQLKDMLHPLPTRQRLRIAWPNNN